MSPSVPDPVDHLAHDHAELNARVLELGSRVRAQGGLAAGTDALAAPLRELRDDLFLHFAREEEALFPFVTDIFPELAERVNAMIAAHDTICGTLARMCHLASRDAPLAILSPLYERFETSYGDHASSEGDLLRRLDRDLGPAQRRALAGLVAGL